MTLQELMQQIEDGDKEPLAGSSYIQLQWVGRGEKVLVNKYGEPSFWNGRNPICANVSWFTTDQWERVR